MKNYQQYIKCLLLFSLIYTKLNYAESNNVKADNGEVKTLKISVTESCPKMCPGAKKQGFVTDITYEILTKLGYEIDFITLPWARAVKNTTAGKLDAIISPAKKEAPNLIYPQTELAVQGECFYGLTSDNWQPLYAHSFLNRKTIVFKNWTFEADFKQALGEEKYNKSFVVFSVNKDYLSRIINMVDLGRVNAFWAEAIVFDNYLSKHPTALNRQIKKLGCLLVQDLYIGFNPLNPQLSNQLAVQFDQGMQQLRASGRLAQILSDYNVSDWR